MRVRKPVLLALVAVFVSLLAYVYVGFRMCADSVRMNVVSSGWIRSGDFVSCEVENEASLAFPFVSPFYTVRLVVQAESANNAFGCFEDLNGEKWNFTDRYVELGTLGPGESRSVGFFLFPDEGSAYVRLELYLSFLGVSSMVDMFSTYLMYKGNDTYTFMFRI